ncbi:CDP-alcohol phosphatidyltransferase family protein [uncultured Ruminococcus sp.]|jgi:cardiolipin synthase|uniref:CDP-alcohol phosphatidyltransferase family protein n=1 Tax=uncultured Ruminococcus sp. TaxID=165186 RepID=UPI00292D70D1|nr:CDP-alcohol phosphatidyltransferase family protein [uncultured Ruminococcus sp.]
MDVFEEREMSNEKKNEVISKDLMTIPNAISFFRIILITPFVALFIVGRYLTNDYTPAIVVLVISGISDFFDGFIARKFHQESELGKVLDPLADKLTLIAVGVCLICIEPYVLPLMIIMVVKDILMIIGGTVIINQGIIPPKSSWYGKISTFMFYVSVVLVVSMAIFGFRNEPLSLTILGVTAGMMIFALVNYAIIFFRIQKQQKEKKESKDGASSSVQASITTKK